jgi:hypothetical protein
VVDYRIEFTIQRRGGGEEDFTDIGFGSSGTCASPDEAAYAVESIIQNREWETTAGMPGPEEVVADA